MIVVYVSSRCSNCARVTGLLTKIPSLQGARVVDIDRTPVQGIQYVPTLVDQRGKSHVGSEVLEFLKSYEAEIELEPAQFGSSLAFGRIDDGGSMDTSTFGWAL